MIHKHNLNLNEGDNAPDFTLPIKGGVEIKLKDLLGQNIVLYFYPKDMTPGCTKEAIDFSQLAKEFAKAKTLIIGVSADNVARHEKFITKHDLTIILASDEAHKVIEAYGVWVEKNLYGRKYMGIERASFLIDTAGKIVKIWRKVRVKGHAENVLQAAIALKK